MLLRFWAASDWLLRGTGRGTDQVGGDEGPDEEAHIDVNWVTAVLSDLGQTGQSRRYHEAKDQQRFEELGAVRDGGVEVHLKEKEQEKHQEEEGEEGQEVMEVRLVERRGGEGEEMVIISGSPAAAGEEEGEVKKAEVEVKEEEQKGRGGEGRGGVG